MSKKKYGSFTDERKVDRRRETAKVIKTLMRCYDETTSRVIFGKLRVFLELEWRIRALSMRITMVESMIS